MADPVTKADLYKALHELDQSLADRFTALDDHFNTVHERIGLVDERLTEHTKNHQAGNTRAGGIAGLVAAFLVAMAAALGDLLRR